MVTGDNELTACQVSKELGIISQPLLVLTASDGDWHWASVDGEKWGNLDELVSSKSQHDLCVTGEGLEVLEARGLLRRVAERVRVWARMSPDHKQELITLLNKRLRRTTLMCGDGTNDVGALKQAHVGAYLFCCDHKGYVA